MDGGLPKLAVESAPAACSSTGWNGLRFRADMLTASHVTRPGLLVSAQQRSGGRHLDGSQLVRDAARTPGCTFNLHVALSARQQRCVIDLCGTYSGHEMLTAHTGRISGPGAVASASIPRLSHQRSGSHRMPTERIAARCVAHYVAHALVNTPSELV